ncbi:MAG: hypothetical protein AB1696_20070 [Planctomycetota bacterium]
MADARDNLIDCKDSPYSIKRSVCWARQAEGRRGCRRCPERGRQLFLFGSPRQVIRSRNA